MVKKVANGEILKIENLKATVGNDQILKGVTFSVKPHEIHAIMGPNGGGKSTLAYALMGHPLYNVTINHQPSTVNKKTIGVWIGKTNILGLPTEDRAKQGLYLAFQSPTAIVGVSALNLLRTAYQEKNTDSSTAPAVQNPVFTKRAASGLSFTEFTKKLKDYARFLKIDQSFLTRGIHDGFSGGEKKKMEMLQALVLQPKFAIFDEIDTGLDVDALALVALGIKKLAQGGTGVIVITHYQRILKYLKPDVVHILVGGKIVETGSAKLAKEIEKEGYKKYLST